MNLYISQLPVDVDEDKLLNVFSPYGNVTQHKVLKYPNGVSKQQGFVKFDSVSAAEYAVKALNGYVFPGTTVGISVKYSEEKKPKIPVQFPSQPFVVRNRSSFAQRGAMGQLGVPSMGMGMGTTTMGMSNPTAYGYPGYTAPVQTYQQQSSVFNPMLNRGVTYPQTTATPAHGANENNLFICHLPPSADDALLYRLFSPFGAILNAKVVIDPNTNTTKGYGFVKYSDYYSAVNAIKSMNGYALENKFLQVTFKK